ncbi:MAG TPA: adenosine kinase, partial [Rhodospirillaceae bacterium]|nr:adenosine kinase [Rhodospirillaceae bacterium]
LWDPPAAKQAFRKAASIAHAAGRQVALSLSDPFCVERHRDEFRQLLADHVDILFANEAEICSLFQADFDEALRQARSLVAIGAVTRGAAGSVVFDSRNIVEQPAEPVADLVDTTGAGDLYAAGFLYGHSRSLGLAVAARLGGICAAEIISHFGARPAVNLAQRIGDLGLA